MAKFVFFKKNMAVLCTALLLAGCLAGCEDTAKENQLAYKTVGINALEAGDYPAAVDAFSRALEQSIGIIGAEEIDLCYYKADALYRSGDTEGALNLYQAMLAYDDKLSEAYFLRGNLYLDQGNATDAIADYHEAVKYDDKDLALYIAICENLTNTGHAEEGKEFLTQATTITGDQASDHALRGRAYTLLGNYLEADKELQEAVLAGDTDALLYRGQLLMKNGDGDGARALYESYLEKKGENAEAYNALGCMEMQIGDYASALSYFEQALANAEQTGVNPQEILRNRILAYEYNGQFAQAKIAMEEYAATYPLDTDMEKEYTFLQTR